MTSLCKIPDTNTVGVFSFSPLGVVKEAEWALVARKFVRGGRT